MKKKLLLVERKPSTAVSIERVFREVAKHLPSDLVVEFQSVPYGNGLLAIIGNLLFFSAKKADVYHVTGDVHYITLRLPRDKVVLTIHDLIFLHRRKGFRRAVLKKLFLELPIRASRVVTTVSDATKQEVVREARVDPEQIVVIDDPILEGFNPDRRAFNDVCPSVLQIGTAVNKNVMNLVRALEGIDCTLTIVGPLSGEQKSEILGSGVRLTHKNSLDGEAVIQEYRDADIVAYCSTYEGFGLPILEAQAVGRPVVTSRLAPMNFVAGEGALLVDPQDPAEIRGAIRSLIDDRELRERLVRLGFENIKRFDTKRVSQEYMAVYRELLGLEENA